MSKKKDFKLPRVISSFWVFYFLKNETKRKYRPTINQFSPFPLPDISELIIHRHLSTFEDVIIHNPECIFLQSSKNFTYLHVAAYYNVSEIINFLLIHGCSPKLNDVIGSTVYHVAVYHDSIDVLKELCKHDATDAINMRTGYAENDTPLKSAIATNKDEIKKVLLSHPYLRQCSATECWGAMISLILQYWSIVLLNTDGCSYPYILQSLHFLNTFQNAKIF